MSGGQIVRARSNRFPGNSAAYNASALIAPTDEDLVIEVISAIVMGSGGGTAAQDTLQFMRAEEVNIPTPGTSRVNRSDAFLNDRQKGRGKGAQRARAFLANANASDDSSVVTIAHTGDLETIASTMSPAMATSGYRFAVLDELISDRLGSQLGLAIWPGMMLLLRTGAGVAPNNLFGVNYVWREWTQREWRTRAKADR